MNAVFPVMIGFAFICALFTGRMGELSASVINGADNAVSLLIKLFATMCFWGGIMEVWEKSGVTAFLSKIINPFLRLIFPSLKKEKYVLEAVSVNVTANMLGLGNAVTPLGLEAMRRLQSLNGNADTATDEMVVFVVMNTAAMRIIPTTVASIRGQYGSEEPMAILLPTLLTTFCSMTVAITVAKLGCRISSKGRKSLGRKNK